MNDIFGKYLDGVIERSKANGTFEEGVKMMNAQSFKVLSQEEVYSHRTGQNTMCLEIQRTDNTEFNCPKAIVEKYGADGCEFIYNETSGNVAVSRPASHITTETGEVRKRTAIHRVATIDVLDSVDYAKSYWKIISTERFYSLWEQQKMLEPVTKTRKFRMVSGLLLPVWKALPFT